MSAKSVYARQRSKLDAFLISRESRSLDFVLGVHFAHSPRARSRENRCRFFFVGSRCIIELCGRAEGDDGIVVWDFARKWKVCL